MGLHNYTDLRIAGEGRTSTVYIAHDVRCARTVALKIFALGIDNIDIVTTEVLVLRAIHSSSDDWRQLFQPVLECSATHSEAYICLPLLEATLAEALQLPGINPLHHADIGKIFGQVMTGIQYLHDMSIIHTDVKSTNVMFKSSATRAPRRSPRTDQRQAELVFLELYIIDLGDCVSAAKPGYSMIGTEFCRPPEVTLGLSWNVTVDSFTLGCLLAELCSGRPLFAQTCRPVERLFLLERVIGHIPLWMTFKSRLPQHVARDIVTGAIVVSRRSATEASRLRTLERWPTLEEQVRDDVYLRVCRSLLHIDPYVRALPSDCLVSLATSWLLVGSNEYDTTPAFSTVDLVSGRAAED